MKRFFTSTLLVATAAATLATGRPASAEPVTYEIDPVHSSVLWKVLHMGTSNAWGRFNDVSGKIVLDEEDQSKSSLVAVVKADSIDSANEKRDQHLKGPDFLNAKQFPEMKIESTKLTRIDDKTWQFEGNLTFRGVTKPVSFKFVRTGTGKHAKTGKELAGGEAEFTFKRSDFGMNYMPQGLGDEITVVTSIEAVRQ